MGKKLCSPDINYTGKKYVEKITSPEFVCKKCGRAANAKKYLCQAQTFKSKQ